MVNSKVQFSLNLEIYKLVLLVNGMLVIQWEPKSKWVREDFIFLFMDWRQLLLGVYMI